MTASKGVIAIAMTSIPSPTHDVWEAWVKRGTSKEKEKGKRLHSSLMLCAAYWLRRDIQKANNPGHHSQIMDGSVYNHLLAADQTT